MRQIRLRIREPGKGGVDEHTLDVHSEDGKVRLVVLKVPWADRHRVESYVASGINTPQSWAGASIVCMAPGSEFEVWEEVT